MPPKSLYRIRIRCRPEGRETGALLGSFLNFDQSSARPTGFFRYTQVEFYGQDTWQLSRRLTLDYGMRFVYITPQYDRDNQIALFTPSAYNPAAAVTIDTSGNIW